MKRERSRSPETYRVKESSPNSTIIEVSQEFPFEGKLRFRLLKGKIELFGQQLTSKSKELKKKHREEQVVDRPSCFLTVLSQVPLLSIRNMNKAPSIIEIEGEYHTTEAEVFDPLNWNEATKRKNET
jgi:hypothetical protein